MKAAVYSRIKTTGGKQMRSLVAAALVAAGLSPSLAGASDANGRYSSDGPANELTCGTFVSAREEAKRGNHLRENRYTNWLYGYVTAYNVLQPDTYDIDGSTDTPSQLLWLENYCKSHPLDSFAQAAEALTTVLYPNRLKVQPRR